MSCLQLASVFKQNIKRELKMKMELEKLQLKKETATATGKVETLKTVADKSNKQRSFAATEIQLYTS